MSVRPPSHPGRMRRARQRLLAGLAAVLVPGAILALVELGLRLFGFGHPPGFLIPVADRPVHTTNQRFGWRFFAKAIARQPTVFELPPKPEGAYRVFVLGGSAAMGTPEPGFGLARVLEVLLEERHPGRRFEVYNAAMAAINSHVVLPIARDCAAHDPDLFVLYTGNNEVVGPFGAGTVFQPLSPSLGAVRAGVRLKGTRLGQLLDGWIDRWRRPTEWRGMAMFRERLVAADSPHLETVYSHFHRNLRDLVAIAERAGAHALLATVAVNLEDSPPFASLHRSDLPPAELDSWQLRVRQGAALAAAGEHRAAAARYEAALALDDRYAELHFRYARELRAVGRLDDAREHFSLARDLDALRFRADSQVNAIIRRVARRAGAANATLVDAAAELRDAPPGGEPGGALFYEHVHLRPAGNYRLAAAVLRAIEARLPPATGPWPAPEAVERRLVLTPFDVERAAETIFRLTSRPPFDGQIGHERRRAANLEELRRLRRPLDDDAWREARERYRAACAQAPGDVGLAARFAQLVQSRGETASAAELWKRLVDRIPGVPAWQTAYALALADLGRFAAAEAELRRLLVIYPRSASVHVNLGTLHESAGDLALAKAAYEEALRLHPGHRSALYNLAELQQRSGQPQKAVETLQELVELHPDFGDGHASLGAALLRRDELEAAAASYREAVRRRPDLARSHNGLGSTLERLGRLDEAEQAYREAVASEPRNALSLFNLADLLLATGRAQEASERYRAALSVQPQNHQGRYNLAGALMVLGAEAEAIALLDRLLEVWPEHPGLFNNLAWLLATADDRRLRSPERAVRLAETASRLTGGRAPEILETLAAAYASTGRWQAAEATASRAAGLARKAGQQRLAEVLEARLESYRAGRSPL